MKYINGMETTLMEEIRMKIAIKQASRIFGEKAEPIAFVLPERFRRKVKPAPRKTKRQMQNKNKMESQRPGRTAKAIAMIESCGYPTKMAGNLVTFEFNGETVSYDPFGGNFRSPSFKGRAMANLFKIIR